MSRFQLILLIWLPITGVMAQVNRPPMVTIERPVWNSYIPVGVPVPYAIRVSDAEDGDSRFEEIPSGEVLLVVKPLTDTAGSTGYRKAAEELLPGLFRMRAANCLTCHAATATLIGPSLAKIASRYRAADVGSLARKVRAGGSGVWGDVAMPAHSSIPEEEAHALVNWIITHFQVDPPDIQTGSSGVFRVPTERKWAGCMLVAAYLDHGAPDQRDGKTGSATIRVMVR